MIGGRRQPQRFDTEAQQRREGGQGKRNRATDNSGTMMAWATVLLMIGMSSALEYLGCRELASAVRSQLVVPAAAATMTTLQWMIEDINHLQVVTVSIEAAFVMLGLQRDCGEWGLWIAELAITAWLVMKATNTWRKQTDLITSWGSGTIGTILLSVVAASITADNMGCWMVVAGWICWAARLSWQYATAWWYWLWRQEAYVYEISARYKAMTVRFKCSGGKV